jgi:hypothetical protein
MKREKLKFEICEARPSRVVSWRGIDRLGPGPISLEQGVMEGENPVCGSDTLSLCHVLEESGCLGMQLKMGGKFHLRLNIGERPIANK